MRLAILLTTILIAGFTTLVVRGQECGGSYLRSDAPNGRGPVEWANEPPCEPEVTPEPTAVPEPTATSVPTATPVPPTATATQPPTRTATTVPTATRTAVPTPTRRPRPPRNPNAVDRIVPDQYPTLSAALAASQPDDNVLLRSGSYLGGVQVGRDNLLITSYGDGPVWIVGGGAGIEVLANDVTIRSIGIRDTWGQGVLTRGDRTTVENTTIQNYNRGGGYPDQFAAGIAAWYAGPGHEFVSNTIIRDTDPTKQRAGGNGIWFKSNSTDRASGGGHLVAYNFITGGYDGIGGESEDDPHGSYDRDTLITGNTIRNCLDDGIQSEGGNVNVRITFNTIQECGIGIALAPNLIGPLFIERNHITSSSPSWAGNLECFKVGNNGAGFAYLTDNFCNVQGSVGNTGNGLGQTNSGLQGFVLRGNTFIVTRYIFDFSGGPLAGSSFQDACYQTADSSRWIKWGGTRYGDHTAAMAASNGMLGPVQVGNCAVVQPGATAVPVATATYLPTLAPTLTPTLTLTRIPTPTRDPEVTVGLHTYLQSHWTMEEASGNYNDSHGSNHLTRISTVAATTGIIGNAAEIVQARGNEYLYRASNASLQTGDVDFAFGIWVYLGDTGDQILIGKDVDSPANSRDYTIDIDSGHFRGYVNGGAGGLIVTAADAISSGAWYYVVFEHDSVNDLLKIRVNDGTVASVSTGGTAPEVSSAEFRIGARAYSGFEGYLTARVDEISYFKGGLPTDAEWTYMYNEGDGQTYPLEVASTSYPFANRQALRALVAKF